jgi:7,8-didemethyl-8-hydroxy-5-deazariboflavin synthase CofG subunit
MASAGRLAIPFTTGIIVGVGETREERARALRAIAAVHASHGHVQEVIVQPFSPARGSPMEGAPPPSGGEVLDALALARLILPPKVSVQVPPNLLRADLLAQALEVADDLGGVSPLTPDLISPDRPWPSLGSLGELCAGSGFVLRRRLPVRERFVSPRHLAPRVLALAREALARG